MLVLLYKGATPKTVHKRLKSMDYGSIWTLFSHIDQNSEEVSEMGQDTEIDK